MQKNDTVRTVFIWLTLYFALHLIVRLLVSPGLELDEAEQLLLTQDWQWGYGAQPPLYTWLQTLLFSSFGVNIFSLALLKNLLLLGTYFFVFQTGRLLGYGQSATLSAMLSLFFLPQIVWESQRDLTHSVLATTLTAATLAAWVQLRNSPTWRNYLIIGFCWGLGLLSKYNYGIFLSSLLIASLGIPAYRQLMLGIKFVSSILITLTILSPHGLWVYNNIPLMLSSSHKFKIAEKTGYGVSVINGLSSLTVATLSFVGLLLVCYAIIRFLSNKLYADVPWPSYPKCTTIENTLLIRCIGISLFISVGLVFIFKVTVFKDRWMQQVLFFLPVALLPWTHVYFYKGGARLIRNLALATGIIVLCALAVRARVAPLVGTSTRFNLPYYNVSRQLEPEITRADLVLADTALLGGTIRKENPQMRVTVPGVPVNQDIAPHRVLVVWHDTSKPDISNRMFSAAQQLTGTRVPVLASSITLQHLYNPAKELTIMYAIFDRLDNFSGSHSR